MKPRRVADLRFPTSLPSRLPARAILALLIRSGGIICRVRYRAVDLSKLEEVDQVILAANHYSLFDTVFIHTRLPASVRARTATVGGLDYFRARPHHSWRERTWRNMVIWFIRSSLNVALIDRVGGDYSEFDRLDELVKGGWNLLIFPEATRSRSGKPGRFHLGAAELARRNDLPVLPVRIEGTQNILPPGVSWPVSGQSIIRFGEPFKSDEGETSGQMTQRIVAAIRAIEIDMPESTSSSTPGVDAS